MTLLDEMAEALRLMNDDTENHRRFLIGTERQIAIWKTIYGNGVDYIVSKPLPLGPMIAAAAPKDDAEKQVFAIGVES